MIELAWLAAGAIGAALVLQQRKLRQRTTTAAPPPAPPLAERTSEPPATALAEALAGELANLISGVEGRAHAMIEQAPQRHLLPQAAESLLRSIQRLRLLHRKLLAYTSPGAPRRESINLDNLVRSLSDDLQHLQLGLEVRWSPAPEMPAASGDPAALREALLFLVEAMLRAERGATRLTIDGRSDLAEELPRIALEMALEWVAEPTTTTQATSPCTDAHYLLARHAATNLLRQQAGELHLEHRPGHAISATVLLPMRRSAATEAAAPPPAAAPAVTGSSHPYGGVLVVEADAAVRAMLATELKAAGRAVFACADSASARSMLLATPDRFEIVIVDHANRLGTDDALGAVLRSTAPPKLCVLGNTPETADWPQLHRVPKPFGVHELRQALASLLAGG